MAETAMKSNTLKSSVYCIQIMWHVIFFQAPLLLGCDVRSLSADIYSIISNEEVIAVNQGEFSTHCRVSMTRVVKGWVKTSKLVINTRSFWGLTCITQDEKIPEQSAFWLLRSSTFYYCLRRADPLGVQGKRVRQQAPGLEVSNISSLLSLCRRVIIVIIVIIAISLNLRFCIVLHISSPASCE